MRSKTRALALTIAQTDYLEVVFFQEPGKLPLDFVFHPMYLAISSRVEDNSSGLAILLHRVVGLQRLEKHRSPDNRAVVARIQCGPVTLKLVNLYLKSGSAAYELRPTLLWVQPHLYQHQEDQLIMGGAFQHNPGWHPGFPQSAPSVLSCFSRNSSCLSIPGPPNDRRAHIAWVSPQGHVGAPHHVISMAPATITSRINVVFPSDHIPQPASFQSIHPISPTPAIHAKGRYFQFGEAYGRLRPTWRDQPLNVAVLYFCKAVEHAI